MCIVDWLSQNNVTGTTRLMCRSLNNEDNQTISHVAFAIDLYLASADDLDTMCCFLDFQEINESPKNTQKPETECRVSGQMAQSESEKALNLRLDEEL